MTASHPLSGADVRFLRKETLKAIAQGSIPPAIAMWFLIGGFPMALWGGNGFAAFQFKNSFGMAVVMTLLMSLGTRAGCARGSVPRLAWTRASQPLLNVIPRHLLLRVLVFALADMAIVGSLSFVISVLGRLDGIGHLAFVLFMGAQCAANALFLAPLILIGAMTDHVAAKASTVILRRQD